MHIFFRKISHQVTCNDLRVHVEAALQWPFGLPICAHGEVGTCRILSIRDEDTGALEHHGLVEVQPRKAALRVLKRLHHSRIKGRLVETHEYRSRKQASLRSEGEHRRQHLDVEEEYRPQVRGLDGFRRSYGA